LADRCIGVAASSPAPTAKVLARPVKDRTQLTCRCDICACWRGVKGAACPPMQSDFRCEEQNLPRLASPKRLFRILWGGSPSCSKQPPEVWRAVWVNPRQESVFAQISRAHKAMTLSAFRRSGRALLVELRARTRRARAPWGRSVNSICTPETGLSGSTQSPSLPAKWTDGRFRESAGANYV